MVDNFHFTDNVSLVDMLIIFLLCSDAFSYYWASEAIKEFDEKNLFACLYIICM